MSRLPVAQRRTLLIDAALTVASRDGIDAATVRAVAAEAGVSLGVVHYCFVDKGELFRAVATRITEQNLALVDTSEEAGDLQSVLARAVDGFWTGITANRGAQLLSYELTTFSLRQAEMRHVALDQYQGTYEALEGFLERIEHGAGIAWLVPRQALARITVAVVDGLALAWLVDGDEAAGRAQMLGFARFLMSQAVPLAQFEDLASSDLVVEHAILRA